MSKTPKITVQIDRGMAARGHNPDFEMYQPCSTEWLKKRTTDAQRGNSLHCTAKKFKPIPKLLCTAEAYFVCHIDPSFQISVVKNIF